MTHDLLRTLMLSTLASSAAMLLVLALRKPMRRQFGAHATYALWMLAPLSAVIALLPAPMAAYSIWMMPTGMIGTVAATAIAIPPAPGIDLMLCLAGIWFAGSCIVCAVFVRQQQRFVRGLGHLKRFSPDIAFAQTNAGCPALVGAWRPRVVLPADFEQRYSAAERKLILAHEHAHRRRGDAQINALVATLRCVFWFNPLIHFATSRFRFDQELACDAAVIARFPQARRRYADAMLKTQVPDSVLPAGCHWQSIHPLKERIVMLKQPLPGRARAALGLGVAVALVIGGTYVAWAAQPVAPGSAEMPAFRKTVAPAYPEAAKQAKQMGEITLKVLVDEKGEPKSATVFKAEPPEAEKTFAEASIAAAMQWQFSPGTKDGKPQPGYVLVPITYRITDDD